MCNPVRLQRKRTKGFKLISPNGLPIVYVGRGSKWGNPWFLEGNLVKYKDPKTGATFLEGTGNIQTVIGLYKDRVSIKGLLDELRGKNLACWCALDQPCHADILLEIANDISFEDKN